MRGLNSTKCQTHERMKAKPRQTPLKRNENALKAL